MEDIIFKADTDDGVNIQFTSGTTGNPKGAFLSHHGILNNAYQVYFNLVERRVITDSVYL